MNFEKCERGHESHVSVPLCPQCGVRKSVRKAIVAFSETQAVTKARLEAELSALCKSMGTQQALASPRGRELYNQIAAEEEIAHTIASAHTSTSKERLRSAYEAAPSTPLSKRAAEQQLEALIQHEMTVSKCARPAATATVLRTDAGRAAYNAAATATDEPWSGGGR